MPERNRFTDVRRGLNRIKADELNALQDTVESLSRPIFGNGLSGGFGPGGFRLSTLNRRIFGQLTAVNNAAPPAYSWARYIEKGDGTFVVDPDGATGGPGQWPAYDVNASGAQPLNTIVRLLPSPAAGEYYLIQPLASGGGGGGGGTLASDGCALKTSAAQAVPANGSLSVQWGSFLYNSAAAQDFPPYSFNKAQVFIPQIANSGGIYDVALRQAEGVVCLTPGAAGRYDLTLVFSSLNFLAQSATRYLATGSYSLAASDVGNNVILSVSGFLNEFKEGVPAPILASYSLTVYNRTGTGATVQVSDGTGPYTTSLRLRRQQSN